MIAIVAVPVTDNTGISFDYKMEYYFNMFRIYCCDYKETTLNLTANRFDCILPEENIINSKKSNRSYLPSIERHVLTTMCNIVYNLGPQHQ